MSGATVVQVNNNVVEAGQYWVSVTDANSCVAVSEIVTIENHVTSPIDITPSEISLFAMVIQFKLAPLPVKISFEYRSYNTKYMLVK